MEAPVYECLALWSVPNLPSTITIRKGFLRECVLDCGLESKPQDSFGPCSSVYRTTNSGVSAARQPLTSRINLSDREVGRVPTLPSGTKKPRTPSHSARPATNTQSRVFSGGPCLGVLFCDCEQQKSTVSLVCRKL
jgi:hypothetical protein